MRRIVSANTRMSREGLGHGSIRMMITGGPTKNFRLLEEQSSFLIALLCYAFQYGSECNYINIISSTHF